MGYIIAGMKDVKEAQIGDTLYLQEQPVEAFPGFKPAKAMVFAGKKRSLAHHTNTTCITKVIQYITEPQP